jgi:hypothetical protein
VLIQLAEPDVHQVERKVHFTTVTMLGRHRACALPWAGQCRAPPRALFLVRACLCAVEAVELAGLDATALGPWGRAAALGTPAMAAPSSSSILLCSLACYLFGFVFHAPRVCI